MYNIKLDWPPGDYNKRILTKIKCPNKLVENTVFSPSLVVSSCTLNIPSPVVNMSTIPDLWRGGMYTHHKNGEINTLLSSILILRKMADSLLAGYEAFISKVMSRVQNPFRRKG